MATSNRSLAVVHSTDEFDPIIDLVVNSVTSDHSKRVYAQGLTHFLDWWDALRRPPMTKALLQRYRSDLERLGLAPATINLRMSAVRKLAVEAADNGLIPQELAASITRVKGVKAAGVRMGNWLTQEQAQALIDSPDLEKLIGLRDRAILALILGSGLRRSEVAALTFAHLQQREGRWVIVDLVGKGRRVRSVPIGDWVKEAIDDWARAAGIREGRVFRPLNKGGKLSGPKISAQVVYRVVEKYARPLGLEVAVHDLRRTFSKLARKGGAEIEQIQYTLGHADPRTTKRYLGEDQRLTDAPADRVGLGLNKKPPHKTGASET